MYTNEFSSKLDIKSSDYVDDGFDINGDDYQLPKQIVSKRSNNGDLLRNKLKKQIKARPSEKISNIVMNTQATFNIDNSKTISFIGNIIP